MKLNFGCGSIQPDGWVNLDTSPEFGMDVLPPMALEYTYSTAHFDDDHFDLIVAHCALQQVCYNEVPGQLQELCRILKPEGVLRISLPDIVRGFIAYSNDDIDWFPNGEDSTDARFSNWLTWYSTTRSLWTQPEIMALLSEAGFSTVCGAEFEGEEFLDTRQGECYFVEAVK